MANIHETLKQLRLDRGLTQEEVAEQLNVTRQAVSSYESGRTQPNLDMLQQLADIYDTELMDIIYGKLQTGRLYKALKITAVVISALLLLILLGEALALWLPNTFFPLADGLSSEEVRELLGIRRAFESTREICMRVSSGLSTYGFTALLVLALCLPRPLSAKTKLHFAGSLLLGSVVVIIPWAMTDALFGYQNYFYGAYIPFLWKLILFLPLSLILDGIRLWRRKKVRQKKA